MNYLIECGINSFGYFGNGIINETIEANKIAERFGHRLEFVIYSSFPSRNAGGRIPDFKYSEFVEFVKMLNESQISVSLALNGSIGLENISLDNNESSALELMAENNNIIKSRNMVIIANDSIRTQVKKDYPNIPVIGSCIKTLLYEKPEDYITDLNYFDYIVPMNQDTTPDFLGRFNTPEKWIVLLTSNCGEANLQLCYNHYLSEQADASKIPIDEKTYNKKISRKTYGFTNSCKNRMARLIDRPDDLRGLKHIGINKFKVQRDVLLEYPDIFKFLSD
jgi:hypothetical protein